MTSESDHDSCRESSTSAQSRSEQISEGSIAPAPLQVPKYYPESQQRKLNADSANERVPQEPPRISTFNHHYHRTDLDYELFRLEKNPYQQQGNSDTARSPTNPQYPHPRSIAQEPIATSVRAATGVSGLIEGRMAIQTQFLKLEGSRTFQEMWAVQLTSPLSKPYRCGPIQKHELTVSQNLETAAPGFLTLTVLSTAISLQEIRMLIRHLSFPQKMFSTILSSVLLQ